MSFCLPYVPQRITEQKQIQQCTEIAVLAQDIGPMCIHLEVFAGFAQTIDAAESIIVIYRIIDHIHRYASKSSLAGSQREEVVRDIYGLIIQCRSCDIFISILTAIDADILFYL